LGRLPELWVLARSRRGLLAISLMLIAISRAAGLTLPGSTKFLVYGVIANHRTHLLLPLIGLRRARHRRPRNNFLRLDPVPSPRPRSGSSLGEAARPSALGNLGQQYRGNEGQLATHSRRSTL
jgi:hypothetical protein